MIMNEVDDDDADAADDDEGWHIWIMIVDDNG